MAFLFDNLWCLGEALLLIIGVIPFKFILCVYFRNLPLLFVITSYALSSILSTQLPSHLFLSALLFQNFKMSIHRWVKKNVTFVFFESDLPHMEWLFTDPSSYYQISFLFEQYLTVYMYYILFLIAYCEQLMHEHCIYYTTTPPSN